MRPARLCNPSDCSCCSRCTHGPVLDARARARGVIGHGPVLDARVRPRGVIGRGPVLDARARARTRGVIGRGPVLDARARVKGVIGEHHNMSFMINILGHNYSTH